MDNLIGQTIGPYRIRGLIGEGGMADVYLAVQTNIKREVAIKVLPATFLKDRGFLERFEREVQIIAQLQHPRILPVYDTGEFENQPYIVMAYLTGGSLLARIRDSRGGLPLDETVRLVGQMAEGLDFAHQKGIVHRDFKPSNVLLDEQGNAYLADFGIAKATAETAQLTGTGMIGTPAYIAPEMSEPDAMSPLVDVYALGVTLYQMLAGQVPFRADTPLGVLMAHANKPVPDVRQARPDLPDAVQAVIERAMAKDPNRRTPSAGAVARELQEAATGQAPVVRVTPRRAARAASQPEPAGPSAAVPTAERPRTPVWVWAVAGMVVLSVAATAVLGGVGNRPTPAAPTEATTAAIHAPATLPVTEPATQAPAAAQDGGKIAFVSDRDGTSQIYVMDADGSNQTRLSNNPGNDESPAWSPDGKRIAFTLDLGSTGTRIYMAEIDGSNQARLESGALSFNPAWSPDGKRIAFVYSNCPGSCYSIAVMDSDGNHVSLLSNAPSYTTRPTWSPDGMRIAYGGPSGDAGIVVMDANGSNPTLLIKSGGSPAWSPDGKRIAFESIRDGSDEIYVMNADGSNVTRLTENPDYANSPAWSPDGTSIAFTNYRDGNAEIYVMNADGSNPVNLTHNPADDSRPAWSP